MCSQSLFHVSKGHGAALASLTPHLELSKSCDERAREESWIRYYIREDRGELDKITLERKEESWII